MFEFEIDKNETPVEGSAESQEEDEDYNLEGNHSAFIQLEKLSPLKTDLKNEKNNFVHDEFDLENTYLITNYTKHGNVMNDNSHMMKVLEKSLLKNEIEKEKAIVVKKSERSLRKQRKMEKEKTKGENWFNLPATEITDEIKNDLQILKMRSILDSKQFYKKNDLKVIPKYFQVGKVVEGPADFYSGRIPKSQRKKTLVDELLQDSKFRAYQRKKYKAIVDDNRRRKRSKNFKEKRKPKKCNKDDWLNWN